EDLVIYVRQEMHQFAEFRSGGRNRGAEAAVHGLVGRNVMLPGADAADAAHDSRDFLRRAAFNEFLEPAHRKDVHSRVGHVPIIVQVYGNARVSFDPGNGSNVKNLSGGYASRPVSDIGLSVDVLGHEKTSA